MSTLQAQTSLKERQDLIEVTLAFISLHDGGKLLSVDDDVETANLSLQKRSEYNLNTLRSTYQSELALLQASCMNLLPNPIRGISTRFLVVQKCHILGVTSLTSTLDSALVLTKVDEGGCKTGPVRNAREEQLGSLVQFVFETFFSNLKDICDVGQSQEVLHVVETIGLRVGVRQLGIHLGLANVLPCHLEITNKIVVLASAVRNLDDLSEVLGILSLDVRVYWQIVRMQFIFL